LTQKVTHARKRGSLFLGHQKRRVDAVIVPATKPATRPPNRK
jgi:hypothetical protein